MDNKVESIHLENVNKALVFVADELNNRGINWLLGASGALMVWGVKIVPRDLDIFVSATDIAGLQKIFQKYVTNPLHNFEEGDKKYLEFQMRISEVEIEICELDFKNEEIVFIDFEDRKIPVNPLEKELEFYERRSGKKDRVELIKRRLAELSRVSNMI